MRKGISKSLIARVLGGVPKYTIAQLEEKFPPRNLPDGAMVTRFAPSPTGFMHIGGLYSALIDKKLAQQTKGIFILRIEDTDTKREIKEASFIIVNGMRIFGLNVQEGPVGYNKKEKYIWIRQQGKYSSYFQSKRKDIYHSVAADLLAKGLAYPCFMSQEEMDDIRAKQAAEGMRTGIYGAFAKWRDAEESEIIAELDKGVVPVIRLYSTGDADKKIYCKDAVRGSVGFPENDEDIVLIKSNDGLPTYHFAHLVDDHFMRTTHVVRGEEWLPSLPLHVELFKMMDWPLPFYIHTSTIDKIDPETGKQRKLSKRLDPEADVRYFIKNGYPKNAVLEYLYNIANSAYEENKTKGKIKNIWEDELKIKKIPISGALFDINKLGWWCKEHIAALPVNTLCNNIINWAWDFGTDEDKRHTVDRDYLLAILSIERDDPKRIRKDFITWKQTLEEIAYFFDDSFARLAPSIPHREVLAKFVESFDFKDQKDLWWNKIVKIAADLGMKNGDAAMALRVALTGREQTPDLYSIMQVMGEKRVRERIGAML